MRWICGFRRPRSGKLEAPIASEGPGMDCLIGPPLSARLSHSRRAPVNQQLAASGWLLGAGRPSGCGLLGVGRVRTGVDDQRVLQHPLAAHRLRDILDQLVESGKLCREHATHWVLDRFLVRSEVVQRHI